MKKYNKGYTTGVYDMFHIGHLNIIRNAKEYCDYLVVGVTTDEVSGEKKGKFPIIPYEERYKIVESIKYVDQVVPQLGYDLQTKIEAWKELRFNVMFVGDDWKGTEKWNNIEREFSKLGVDIVYLPHTEGISSTKLRAIINED